MPFWIASTNNFKMRCLFLNILNQIRRIGKIFLWLHIWKNISSKRQYFMNTYLIKCCQSFCNHFLSQINRRQVSNGRDVQVIADKVRQTHRRFFNIELIITRCNTDEMRHQILHFLQGHHNLFIAYCWIGRKYFKRERRTWARHVLQFLY